MPRPSRRDALRAATAAAAAAAATVLHVPRPARARTPAWSPDRPLRVVLGFAPGGASDAALRVLQPRLASLLGQPLVVDNRPGAGGNLAAEAVARAAPDGHTILSANVGLIAVNPALFRALPFDPDRDFRPVSALFDARGVLVSPADRPWRSVADILAAARARPEALTYATGGVGSVGHLAGLLLDATAGVRTVPVHYRGGGPLMTALVAGEADMSFATLGTVVPHLEAGRLRAFAVCEPQRVARLPEVPTMLELGFRDFVVPNHDGLLVPRATPDAAVARLAAAVSAALAEPETVRAFEARGLEAATETGPAPLAARLAADAARWRPLLRAAGVEAT